MPFLFFFCSIFSGFKLANETFIKVFDMVRPYIEEHERTLDPDNIRDFLDLMIVEHKKSTDPKSCFYGQVGQATIANSIVDLFIAGMETTTTSLMLIILHLLHHLDVQQKVHQEIDQVSMSDLKLRDSRLIEEDDFLYISNQMIKSNTYIKFLSLPFNEPVSFNYQRFFICGY